MLQIYKRVSEELGEGDPGLWISLKQPEQKIPAVLGDSGPVRKLRHKAQPFSVPPDPQDDTGSALFEQTLESHIITLCQKMTFKLPVNLCVMDHELTQSITSEPDV